MFFVTEDTTEMVKGKIRDYNEVKLLLKVKTDWESFQKNTATYWRSLIHPHRKAMRTKYPHKEDEITKGI